MKKIIAIIIFSLICLVISHPISIAAPGDQINEQINEQIKQQRRHITLEPVEPEWIPDPNCYYIPWAGNMKISLEDFDLLCHTVFCEAGNQSLEAQKLVAITIINRIASSKFPNSMQDVIYQDNGKQFNVVRWDGFPEAYQYTDQVETACYLAIATDSSVPMEMLFFRSGYYFSEYEPYTYDGDMYFSVKEEDR